VSLWIASAVSPLLRQGRGEAVGGARKFLVVEAIKRHCRLVLKKSRSILLAGLARLARVRPKVAWLAVAVSAGKHRRVRILRAVEAH